MKKFEDPIVEVMTFDFEDVLTTSGETEETQPLFVGPCL
jgi:hypothetical protein